MKSTYFPFVRAGRPDHGRTGHFENEIGFFREFLMKNDFLRAYDLAFDWSGWIALIKSKILITNGMSWLVSSDKWEAPQDSDLSSSAISIKTIARKNRRLNSLPSIKGDVTRPDFSATALQHCFE